MTRFFHALTSVGRVLECFRTAYPGLPDAVTPEAHSHEVSSAGFWPGGGPIEYPAFYSYAYPMPPGFARARAKPEAAFFEPALGECLLPYDAVRSATAPDAELMPARSPQ